ncbi:MAG TPA: helix-turn-helix domain-containing protein [Mycobacteriales bacterium]|nr:helix-turn-helix domain-containing protein [Mycobacteriales bacterium]
MAQTAKADTREQILRAALDLFTQQGYDSTSLRQLADHQGLTKAALYYHFPAKEQLLLELTRPFLDGLSDLVSEHRGLDQVDPKALLGSYLDLFITHLEVLGLLASDPATLHHPDIGKRARLLVAGIRSLLIGPEPTSESTVRAACAMGVINAVSQVPAEALQASRETILDAALGALGEPPVSVPGRGRQPRPPKAAAKLMPS